MMPLCLPGVRGLKRATFEKLKANLAEGRIMSAMLKDGLRT